MAQKKNARERIKKPVVKVPKDRDQMEVDISTLAEKKAKVERLIAQANARIAWWTQKLGEWTQPLEEDIDDLFEGVFVFCQARRDELFKDLKKKSVECPGGAYGFRFNPESLQELDDDQIEAVVAELKKIKRNDLIRTREVPDLSAIKKILQSDSKELAKIPALALAEREEIFFVKPKGIKKEIERSLKRPAEI